MADKAKGYVKVYRSVWDNELFSGEKFNRFEAWIYLLSHAAYKKQVINHNNDVFTIERGQMFTSVRKLGAIFNWKRDTVYRFLQDMESMGMTRNYATHNGTLITVLNYSKFQGSSDQGSEESDTDGTTEGTTGGTTEGATDGTHIINHKEYTSKEEEVIKETPAGRRGRRVLEE